MSSIEIPIPSKICVVCGQDVSGLPRTKDRAGRYYCTPCYEQLRHQRHEAAEPDTAPSAAADPAEDGLSEECRVRQGTDTIESTTALMGASPVVDVQGYIRTTNWLLVAAIFTGIFLAPIGVVLQVICMRRLLQLANRPRQWAWMIAAALPLIGLIPLKLMADRAGKVVHKPLNSIKPLDPEQRRRFRQLVMLQSIAWVMVLIPWLASWITVGDFFAGDIWVALFAAIDMVAIVVALYARARAYPYRKVLREAGGQRIWFSDSSDVARDWTRDELFAVSAHRGRP